MNFRKGLKIKCVISDDLLFNYGFIILYALWLYDNKVTVLSLIA